MKRMPVSRSFLVLASGMEKAARRKTLIGEIERVLRLKAGSLRIAYDLDGCPQLLGASGFISLSHWPGGSALAYDVRGRVGVDVQSFNERQTHAFMIRFGRYRDLPTGLAPARIWTRMEAIGKCLGRGLGVGFDRLFDMAVAPQQPHTLYEWQLDKRFSVCFFFEKPCSPNALEIIVTGQRNLDLSPISSC